MENSAHGLTLLDPDRKVVVTGEEHHQHALAHYAPRNDGKARRVVVELGFTAAPRNRGRCIEVRLDGLRVGVLTTAMSGRYGPLVDDILAAGGRPGCAALVVNGRRGIEMELRLPDVPSDGPVPPVRPAPEPTPVPTPAPRGPGGHRRRGGPRPPVPPTRRRSRKPLWIGAGVGAVLVVIGAATGNGEDPDVTPDAAAPATSVRPRATPAELPATAIPPTDSDRDSERDVDADRDRVPAVDPPAPQPLVAEPEQEPEPEPEPVEVYYANCDAVRAAGADPIRTGDPGYSGDLDRDGDGIACE